MCVTLTLLLFLSGFLNVYFLFTTRETGPVLKYVNERLSILKCVISTLKVALYCVPCETDNGYEMWIQSVAFKSSTLMPVSLQKLCLCRYYIAFGNSLYMSKCVVNTSFLKMNFDFDLISMNLNFYFDQ